MNRHYECIVAGLGAAGSAALYHLAGRGVRVAGFDRHDPPHAFGSSHGESRMIREAYYEDPRYVPLLRRAYELWHDLSAQSTELLMVARGGVFAGPPGGGFISGIRRAAIEHNIAVETVALADRARRFPWLCPDADMETVTEPRAGTLFPERCVATHLSLARSLGATLKTREPVDSWKVDGDGVRVETPAGSYTADRLILAAGAWMPYLLGRAGAALTVTRQTLFWFEIEGDARRFAPDVFPVWAVEFTPGKLLYGFPDVGGGLKVAVHYGGATTTADTVDRTVSGDEVREIKALVDRYLPGATRAVTKTAVCLYTNTPDFHFLVDAHPDAPKVLVMSACSGHGFKFACALGEAAAQWAVDGAPALDLSLFAWRWAN